MTFFQDAYEQFNYKYLQTKEEQPKDHQSKTLNSSNKSTSFAQINSKPQDETLLQSQSETAFLGTLFWKFIDFVSLGAFENHVSDDEKKERGEVNKTSNATPLEPPMSADLMLSEQHPEPALDN